MDGDPPLVGAGRCRGGAGWGLQHPAPLGQRLSALRGRGRLPRRWEGWPGPLPGLGPTSHLAGRCGRVNRVMLLGFFLPGTV